MFTLHGITHGNGIFVAVGRNQIVTSKDGNVWADLRPPPSRLLFGRPYDNGQNFMPIPLQDFGGLGFQGLHLMGSLANADGDFDATKLSRFVVDTTPITGNVFGNQFCIGKKGNAYSPLMTWVDIGIFTNAQTTTRFIDHDATNYPHRFYRVISP